MGARKSLAERNETRARSLARHALTRKLERREKWLERGGITLGRFKLAVDTLVDNLSAMKVLERGPRAGEEVPDRAIRVKAATELADLIRLTIGLTKQPSDVKSQPTQNVIIFQDAPWLAEIKREEAEKAMAAAKLNAPKAIAEPEDDAIIDAETEDDDEGGES
jgi:hypothetical protein